MTHDEAKTSMAAEAYILDDLEPAERLAFEEHFFDCTDCRADVMDAAAVADGVRTETTNETDNVVPFPQRYSHWLAAAAALAVVIGLSSYFAPQIASLWHRTPAPIGQPARITEQVIQLETTRAAQKKYVIRRDQPTAIDFTIPPQDIPPATYICELRDAAGALVKRREVSQQQADEMVSISLLPHALHSGEYDVVIRGGDREISGYHFTVVVQ